MSPGVGCPRFILHTGFPMKRLVALLTLVPLLAMAACSGGTDAVDQSAGGQFRYHNVTAHGKTISEGSRKTVGKVLSGDGISAPGSATMERFRGSAP